MPTKDVVGNGSAAMKEAAMKSLCTGAADSAESSARRTARAGARREPCLLIGHSSTKVGLELGSIGKEPDVRAVRAGSTARDKRGQTLGCRSRRRLPDMASSWRVRAAPPGGRLDHQSPALPAAHGDGGVSRS